MGRDRDRERERERDGRFELKQKEGQYRNQRLFRQNLYSAGPNCCIVMGYSGVDLKMRMLTVDWSPSVLSL